MTTNILLKDYIPLNHILNGNIKDEYVQIPNTAIPYYSTCSFGDETNVNRYKYVHKNKYIAQYSPFLGLYSEWGGNYKILIGAFVRKCDILMFTQEYAKGTDLWKDYVHIYISDEGITENMGKYFAHFIKTSKAWIKEESPPIIKHLAIKRNNFKTRNAAIEFGQRAKEEIFSREYRLSLAEYFEEICVPLSTQEPIVLPF